MAANTLGLEMVKRKIDLVYGGGCLRLMGCVLATICLGHRSVLGVVPEAFTNLIGKTCKKELRVKTMHDRLLRLLECADTFIALPKGYGTMEELFHMLS